MKIDCTFIISSCTWLISQLVVQRLVRNVDMSALDTVVLESTVSILVVVVTLVVNIITVSWWINSILGTLEKWECVIFIFFEIVSIAQLSMSSGYGRWYLKKVKSKQKSPQTIRLQSLMWLKPYDSYYHNTRQYLIHIEYRDFSKFSVKDDFQRSQSLSRPNSSVKRFVFVLE